MLLHTAFTVLASVAEAGHEAEPSKTPFYVAGGILAAWAVIVSSIGITQPDFPRTGTPGRIVMAITVVLVAAAATTAITTA
jgi:hypothetical protein